MFQPSLRTTWVRSSAHRRMRARRAHDFWKSVVIRCAIRATRSVLQGPCRESRHAIAQDPDPSPTSHRLESYHTFGGKCNSRKRDREARDGRPPRSFLRSLSRCVGQGRASSHAESLNPLQDRTDDLRRCIAPCSGVSPCATHPLMGARQADATRDALRAPAVGHLDVLRATGAAARADLVVDR